MSKQPIELSSDSSEHSFEENSHNCNSSEYYSDSSYEHNSDRSYDFDSEEGIPLSLRGGYQNALWDTIVTDHIVNRSGVMHFPMRIGKLIPEEMDSILVNEKHFPRSYEMDLHVAK